MKILIVYFSGTGNTAYIADHIKEELHSDYTIEMCPIEELEKSNMPQFDALIFGFPIYACQMPEFLKAKLNRLKTQKAKPVYLFCTKAFYSGTAMHDAQLLFDQLGYFTVYTIDINMPGSDGLAFLKKKSQAAQKIIMKDYDHMPVVEGFVENLKDSLSWFSDNDKGVLEHPIEKMGTNKRVLSFALKNSYPLFENYLKKRFAADERCTLCKRCEMICPVSNIEVTDHVIFKNHCILCMRCLHQCPTEAIQIGKGTINKFRWKGPKGTFFPDTLRKD